MINEHTAVLTGGTVSLLTDKLREYGEFPDTDAELETTLGKGEESAEMRKLIKENLRHQHKADGQIDPFASRILRSVGFEPKTLEMISRYIGVVNVNWLRTQRRLSLIVRGNANVIALPGDPYLQLFRFETRADNQRLVTGFDIPLTTMTQSIGKPLRDIISHPMLDDCDLKVVEIDRSGFIVEYNKRC